MEKKPFWKQEAPKGQKTKHLTSNQKAYAKSKAKKAGQPYPSLVANVAAVRRAKAK